MNNTAIEAITAAFAAVESAYEHYKPLADEYAAAMNNPAKYEPNPDYQAKPGEMLTPAIVIEMIATGEITKTGITNAVAAGKIRNITATKSPAMLAAEADVVSAVSAFETVTGNAMLPFAVKKTRARSASGTTGTAHDEVGEQKKAQILASIMAIDSDAVVAFNGRRVFGCLSSGFRFDYDAYGVSFLQTLAQKAKGQ